MGGTSTTQGTSVQTSQPWKPAIPGLKQIIGGVEGQIGNTGPSAMETGALNQMQTNANAGNPFTGQITQTANDLFSGGPDRSGIVNDAYSQYQQNMAPYTSPDYLDPTKAPGMSDYLNTLKGDISDSISGMFAGAGRDLSGAHVNTLARGLSSGLAAPILNQYNQNVGAQQNASNNLYQAGGATAGLLSTLDQNKLGNQMEGINAADAATQAQNYGPLQTLAIEMQRRGIPIGTLQQLTGILGPIAGLGGTTVGNQQGSQTMSGAQQFGLIAGGLGSLFGGGRR